MTYLSAERAQPKPAALVFLGLPDETWRSARCSIDLWVPAPDVLVTHVNGYAEWTDFRWYAQRADRIIGKGNNLYIFHDFEGMTGHDSQARTKLTEWAGSRNNFLPGSHFLIRTRMTAMAVSVAALALGRPLKAFSCRREFEGTLRDLLVKRGGATRPPETAAPLALRDVFSPVSVREGAGPASIREGAGPVSIRESVAPVSIRGSAAPVSIREGASPVSLRNLSRWPA